MPATPDALLLLASGCPHCPAVLQGLAELVKEGTVGRLEAVNVGILPERAAELGVRSVPWVRIGPLEFDGAMGMAELRRWAQQAETEAGVAAYVDEQLSAGRLPRVEALFQRRPDRLPALVGLIADMERPMQVRVGVGAVLEGLAGDPALATLVAPLGELSTHTDPRVRADACHYLGLTGDGAATDWLRPRLEDEDAAVREVAEEALETLG